MKFFSKSALYRATSLESAALAVAVLGVATAATPAFAQDAQASLPQTAQCADENSNGVCDNEETNTIVVTGSRIPRPNLSSTVPITSIGGETFLKQGQTNIGDTLNDLPQLRSTFAQQNPGLGIGIAGLNLLDLRGLGTQRTLVLVNGRRHVAADILNNAVSPDINTIPNDLIERVDIVTGGNSAIYGSDAIAGVVNFVLRRSYEGLQLRTTGGITEAGFGGNGYVSAMWGKNFNGGASNITLHGEYSRAERVFASDVPAFRSNDNYATVDLDPSSGAGITFGSDGFPDTQFIRNLSSTTIHYAGLIPVNQKNIPGAGPCGNATVSTIGGPNNQGAAFSCTYIFTPDGRLTAQTGTRFGTGINSGIYNSNGQTGREGKTVSVLPFNERFNFNLLARHEFSPAAELFLEAKWARTNVLGNNAGPSFIQGTQTQFDFRERPRLDNPFLNPADRTTLANAILASGCRSDLQVTCPAAGNLTATDTANIANGSYRFVLARNLLDVGLRDEKFQRDTWRAVLGMKGTFNTDWTYEISANYGQFREDVKANGYIDRQRFVLAMDAGRDPTTGQIKCRAQFDPASALAIQRTDAVSTAIAAANAARLAADIAACVPYNPFGTPDNSASIAYFSRVFTANSGLSQFVGSAFMSGDTSGFFNLPGGPISFALGGEYRRETAFYKQDRFATDGFTNGVSIPDFVPPAFEVKEGYGEVRLPLLKDLPLIQDLTLSGAGRVAKYQGKVGTQWSYNAGVDWTPVSDIRFRANYSRAVRAPNVSETGFPLVPNFSNNFSDPCNPANITQSTLRQQNCLADIGATNLAGLTNISQSLPIVSGSNPNLISEVSDSYTVGTVIQPRWIPGFNLSIDYYDITVKNVIASIGVNTLVNLCYDTPRPNIFCGQFTRWNGPGLGPNGEQPGRILGNSLINAPVNFAKRVRRGIDVNFNYRRDFGWLDFSTDAVYTHSLINSNYQDPTNPNFESRVLGQLGDPKDEFRWDFNFGVGPVTLGYRTRYIGPMYRTGYNNLFALNGIDPQNIDAFPTTQFPRVWYHDLRFDIDVLKNKGSSLLVYFGVDNFMNQGVPEGATTATGSGSAIYSFRGRTFFAGARARF